LITVSNDFLNAHSANNRLWKLKVEVKRNTPFAVPVDISDRVNSNDIDFDWERRSASATLEIDNFDYSLSPLNQNSTTNQVAGVYDPLFDSNHTIEIWEGLLTTTGYQYVKKFTGVLGDEIDADTIPGMIVLTARDRSKLLQDAYIFQSKTYSPAAGPNLTIAEYVIQDLITTFLPSESITLQVDTPTNYVVGRPDRPYTAKDINLWDAIQQISDTFNFAVYFDENGILHLKKIIRDFSTVSSVYTFDESKVSKSRVSTSDSDVRNHIMLRVTGLDPIEKKNQDSIDKYGRRYFEVHRSMANIVATAEQAHELVDNILRDLSYVTPIDRLEMPLFPLIQTGDIVSLVNSKLGQDAITYKFRVVNIKDSFSKDKKRTNVQVKGYSTFNPINTPAPNPPTNLAGQTMTRKIQNYPNSGWTGQEKSYYYPLLTWTRPVTDVSGNALTNEFGGYTIYRRGPGESNFYAMASIKSYIAPSNLIVDYCYDYTAVPGNNEYKMVAISKYGKLSSETGILTINKPANTFQL
jgi:hypothetical protein